MKFSCDQVAIRSHKESLTRYIEQRTGARVHGLRVGRANGKVIVYGRVGSHYVRQLALAAALEVMGPEQVEVQIEVGAKT